MELFTLSVSVMSDGDRTVAEATLLDADYNRVTGMGSSGREPGDKPDVKIGTDLAVARALQSATRKLEKRAKGVMKHKEDIKAHKEQIAEAEAEASRAREVRRVAVESPSGGHSAYYDNRSWS